MIAVDRKRGRRCRCSARNSCRRCSAPRRRELRAAPPQPIARWRPIVEDRAAGLQRAFRGAMIDRAAFDAGLWRRRRGRGARLPLGRRRSSDRDGDGARQPRDGRAHRAPARSSAPTARARASGAAIGQVNRELVETRQITVPLRRADAATDIFLSADIPGGYGWLFPEGDVAPTSALGVEPGARRAAEADASSAARATWSTEAGSAPDPRH